MPVISQQEETKHKRKKPGLTQRKADALPLSSLCWNCKGSGWEGNEICFVCNGIGLYD